MNEKQENNVVIPSLTEIQNERKRIRRGSYYRKALRGTVSVLLVVAAVAVLITTLLLPILQISGDSMSPTLEHNEIVVLLKTKKFERGDLVGFYYQGDSPTIQEFESVTLPKLISAVITQFWWSCFPVKALSNSKYLFVETSMLCTKDHEFYEVCFTLNIMH